MKTPSVSIIVPTYNRAHLLPQTIDSILQQCFEDFELILIDDGSTDDTGGLVRSYRDARFIYDVLPHSGNLSQVRNRGLLKARGQYLAFLDSDDLWQPDKLRSQVEMLDQRPDVGLVLCGFEIFDADGIRLTHLHEPQGEVHAGYSVASLFKPLFQGRIMLYPSIVLFRKALLHVTGQFNQRLRLGDHDFLLRLAFHAKAAILHEPLARIRKHDSNMTVLGYEVEGIEQIVHALERFYASGDIAREFYRKSLISCHAGLGKHLLRARDISVKHRVFTGYVRLLPTFVRAWARYLAYRPANLS